ncbi:MAG: RHS repeat protein [Deltaproteobacteria bacterium]|nr:RHS repeat protein [Deltaproteobacteria bacterium]
MMLTCADIYSVRSKTESTFYYRPREIADGASITRQYDQGSIGRLYKVTDSSGSTTYSYDSHGRVTQKQQVTAAVTLTTNYTYDASGRRASMTYPSGRQLAYLYDTGGHVIEIDVDGTPLVSSITYQAFGSAASWTQGSGVSTYSRTFDQDGRVAGINIGANPTINYTYDAAGRITGIIDSNEVRPNLTAGVTSYSVSGGSNQILARSGPAAQTYTYDAAGNLINDGTNTYTYDARGRLVQVTAGSNTTSYAINGLGQRVSKTGAATTIFAYDEAGHLIGGYDATGNVVQETVWLGSLPVGVLKPGALYYVNPDHLGAPRSIIDASGATVWKWDKDLFGNGAPTGTLTYNLRFPGQYFDSETGLYYNMARDYSPSLGRYIQSDPIGLRGGVNTYAYVGGNPVNWVDPEGLQAIPVPNPLLLPPSGSPSQTQLTPGQWHQMKDFLNLFNPVPLLDYLMNQNEGIDKNTDLTDPSTWPEPPVEGECEIGDLSRKKPRERGEKSLWDPEGGEWRPHKPDKYHPEGHWDYNPPSPNSPWVDIPVK